MRRRPGISAGRSGLSWSARRMDVSAGPATVPTCAPPPAPIVRVLHPVVKITHSRWFRVVRLFKDKDGVQAEHIGEFPTATPAILMGTKEQGHARVYDWNNKLITSNGQPMESRP